MGEAVFTMYDGRHTYVDQGAGSRVIGHPGTGNITARCRIDTLESARQVLEWLWVCGYRVGTCSGPADMGGGPSGERDAR